MRYWTCRAIWIPAVLGVTSCGTYENRIITRLGPADADVATLRDGAIEQVISPDDPRVAPNYLPNGFDETLLTADPQLFCPDGFAYDQSTQLCANEAEAAGPFTPTMIAKCKKYGGGPACDGERWSKKFATSLRGSSECPDGSSKRASGLCSDGTSAFGPFTTRHVESCRTNGGGSLCNTSLRWNLSFAEASIPKETPTDSTGTQLAGLKVAIDSGHGRYKDGSEYGWDVGAVNPFDSSVKEWLLNADVGAQVKAKLESMGAKVSLFTYPDTAGSQYLTLQQKGARSAGHQLFLSIHHNSYNSSAQGSEVLVHTLGSAADKTLAAAIQRNLVRTVWTSNNSYNRGVKAANLGVLGGVPAAVEGAVLVEGFFLDPRAITPSVAKAMDVKVAKGVADGVLQYWLSER